jgi:hypothetical protein
MLAQLYLVVKWRASGPVAYEGDRARQRADGLSGALDDNGMARADVFLDAGEAARRNMGTQIVEAIASPAPLLLKQQSIGDYETSHLHCWRTTAWPLTLQVRMVVPP